MDYRYTHLRTKWKVHNACGKKDPNLIDPFMNHGDSWASTGWSMTRMILSMKLATGTLSKKTQKSHPLQCGS